MAEVRSRDGRRAPPDLSAPRRPASTSRCRSSRSPCSRAGRIVVVEIAGITARRSPRRWPSRVGASSRVRRAVGHRCESLAGVERCPTRSPRAVRHRQRLLQRPEVARDRSSRAGGCAERVGARRRGCGPAGGRTHVRRRGSAPRCPTVSNVRLASSYAITPAHGTPPSAAESHCSPAASQAKKPRRRSGAALDEHYGLAGYRVAAHRSRS